MKTCTAAFFAIFCLFTSVSCRCDPDDEPKKEQRNPPEKENIQKKGHTEYDSILK